MKGVVDIEAGICGFSVHIEAEARDVFGSCVVSLETECKNIEKLGKRFEIDIMDTLKHGYRSVFFKRVMELTPPIHFQCAIIKGIYEAVKVAGGIALPRDIIYRIRKE
jgi:hypothetical protein